MLSPSPEPTTTLAAESPSVPWREFYPWFCSQWNQGEHMTAIAPTGWGKTTLMIELLHLRSFLVAFGVKGRDETMDKMIRELGLWKQRAWNSEVADRICLWPDIRGAGQNHRQRQREEFLKAIDGIYRQGGWCAYFDEVVYLAETLRLEDELKFLLNQGRSSHITVVATTQRPAFIPLAFYDQATHLFVGKDTDHRNIRRLAELTGEAAKRVALEVPTLVKHEFMYVNRDSGYRCRTLVEVH